MKILCLHGHSQSGPFFQRKTLKLQRYLEESFPDVTFVFPTASIRLQPSDLTDGRHGSSLGNDQDPIHSTSITQNNELEAGTYGWMKLHDVDEPAFGFYHSIDMLAEILATQGPFDGMIGYSQGTAMVGVIASLLEGQVRREAFDRHLAQYPASMRYPEVFETLNHPPLKFAISYGTIMGVGKTFSALYQDPVIQTPFCHFQGLYDPVVQTQMTQAVREACIGGENSHHYIHPGAHIVPMGRKYLDIVKDFVKDAIAMTSCTSSPLFYSPSTPVDELLFWHLNDHGKQDVVSSPYLCTTATTWETRKKLDLWS